MRHCCFRGYLWGICSIACSGTVELPQSLGHVPFHLQSQQWLGEWVSHSHLLFLTYCLPLPCGCVGRRPGSPPHWWSSCINAICTLNSFLSQKIVHSQVPGFKTYNLGGCGGRVPDKKGRKENVETLHYGTKAAKRPTDLCPLDEPTTQPASHGKVMALLDQSPFPVPLAHCSPYMLASHDLILLPQMSFM